MEALVFASFTNDPVLQEFPDKGSCIRKGKEPDAVLGKVFNNYGVTSKRFPELLRQQ